MTDEQKPKQELIQELDILRQRVATLEQSELAGKRAEEALRESEEKYRAVFENTGAATVVIEENSIISLANAEFVGLSGYSLGEIEGKKSWTEFVVKEDLERMQAQHRLRRQNAEKALRHYEFRFVRRNGDIRNISLSIDVIRGTTKSVASLLDITERKRAEEALYTEKQRFQALSEQAPFGMVMINQDGTFKYINPKFRELFGYELADVPDGKTWFRKAYPDPTYRHHVIETWIKDLEVFKPGEKRFEVFIVTCKDGTEKIINFIPVQLATGENLMACEDITERKRAEEALRESEIKYREIFESLEDLYYLTDSQGIIRALSPSLYRLAGWRVEELIGKPVTDTYIDPSSREKLLSILAQDGFVRDYEVLLKKKDGTAIPVSVGAHLVLDKQGHPVGISGIVRDITERKRAEERLRKSEEKYRNLFETVIDGVFIADGHGRFLEVNKSACQQLGYSRDELLRLSVLDISAITESGIRVLQEKINTECLLRYETTHRRKDGTIVPIELVITGIQHEGQRVFLGVARDITERKQAEEELRDSEGRFRTLFEKSTEAQLLMDPGGKVVDYNTAFRDLLALQDETESMGHTAGDFAPEFQPDGTPSRERGREMLKTVLERGSARYEWAHLKHDASRTPILTEVMCTLLSISGQPMIHVAIRDITARKRAEEALQESEEKFRLSFESANTGMCLVDMSGNLMRVNEKMCAIFGYRKQELESMTVNNIAVPEDANLSPEFINKASAGEMDSAVFEKRYYHKDGHIVWGLVSSSLVRDANGKPSYFISQVQDITERKQAEEELQESEEQARQLAQENAIMAEIGRIISSTLNISEVYELFAQQVQKLISFDRLNINLIDHEARTAISAYSSGRGVKGRQIGNVFPLEGTAVDEIIRTHSGMLLHPQDEAELERRFPGLVSSFQARHRSMMVVPLISKGKVIASLYFGSTQPKPFTERHLKLAENIGAQIAGAIVNAQLYTEWKKTEEALRESEERFRDLYDSAPVGYHACDAEGRITNVNHTELEMLGYSPQEMIGQYSWKLNVEEDLARQRILEKLAGLRPPDRSFERTYRRKDGTIFPVLVEDRLKKDENGRITGIRCTIQDFTDRKRAEEGLLRSEEKAKQLAQENAIMAEIGKIISSTPNIDEVYDRFAGEARKLIPFDRININIINPEEKTVTTSYGMGSVVSGRQPGDVFHLAGTALEEIMRTHSGLLVQTDNASDLAERFPGLLPHFQAGQRSMLAIPLISKDRVIGGLFLGSARLNAYTNRDLKLAESIGSQIAGAIANAQLFSERQRLEERLRRAEKMEALGTLAGGVAHDLNNVLGVLVGYSELLLMEIQEGSPLRRHVSNILQSGQRAAAIIQDLLTLARRGVAVSEVVNLNPVISDYFKTPEFEKLKTYHPRVTFVTDLDKDLMNIKGSPIHLSKTLMNLLSNAAEAITDRGEVTLVTENRYLDKPITGYDHIQEGDYVVLKVSDNGKGISGGDMGKIFEPFYTKKVMGRRGTGLGLAVVWGTVKDHGGYIDVQSEEGKGSAFTLYFPVTREEIVSDQKVVSLESYMGRGESILVVDDVKEQRELATAMLNNLGYRVSAVSSGEEALAHIKADKVDLMVLDMIMYPGMDGLETYQKVLEINPKQKAIIVSGFSETDRVKKAQELGAGAYVRKPYIREKIGLAIKRELDK